MAVAVQGSGRVERLLLQLLPVRRGAGSTGQDRRRQAKAGSLVGFAPLAPATPGDHRREPGADLPEPWLLQL